MASTAAVEIVPRRFRPLVVGSLVVAVVFLAIGNFSTDAGEPGDAAAFIIATAITLIAAFALWRFVVGPRIAVTGSTTTPGLVLGVLALLFSLVFWLGVTWAFAPAAIALGTVGKERGEGGAATAALLLGWLGLAVATGIALVDALS